MEDLNRTIIRDDLNVTNSTLMADVDNYPYDPSYGLVHIRRVFTSYISPALCLFGFSGNILNMIVLTRRRMQLAIDNKMERTACMGLISLAMSDLCYCGITFPEAFSRPQIVYYDRSFWMFYHLYSGFCRNVFSYTSTWITVIMALGRYVAICHPLHARIFINPGATRLALILAFLIWIGFSSPEIWSRQILDLSSENSTMYMVELGPFGRDDTMNDVFTKMWFAFGFGIPIIVLAFCNIQLIRALRESSRMRRHYRVHNSSQNPGSKITPTLIAVVMMFIFLVSPSEIVSMIQHYTNDEMMPHVQLAAAITNVMHTLNFAANFVLYCVVNTHFRTTVKETFCKSRADSCCATRTVDYNRRTYTGVSTNSMLHTNATEMMNV